MKKNRNREKKGKEIRVKRLPSGPLRAIDLESPVFYTFLQFHRVKRMLDLNSYTQPSNLGQKDCFKIISGKLYQVLTGKIFIISE
jgi:hypothetical protein